MKKTVFRDPYIDSLKPKDKTYRKTEGNGFYIGKPHQFDINGL